MHVCIKKSQLLLQHTPHMYIFILQLGEFNEEMLTNFSGNLHGKIYAIINVVTNGIAIDLHTDKSFLNLDKSNQI